MVGKVAIRLAERMATQVVRIKAYSDLAAYGRKKPANPSE